MANPVRGTLPGDPDACDPSEPQYVITTDCRARMQASLADEDADAIVALGDLVYTAGPTCPEDGLTEGARETLDRAVGSYFGALGPPVLLVLGNHDLHQMPGHPGALRCYLDYAVEEPNIELPERNYLVRLGSVLLVVLDSNRHLDGNVLYTWSRDHIDPQGR